MQPNEIAITDSTRHKAIVAGLVGNRTNLYHNSAMFAAQMNQLGNMLITWADSLADAADKDYAAMEARIAAYGGTMFTQNQQNPTTAAMEDLLSNQKVRPVG